ncbi:MAG: rod shape-determining protein MreD [Lachnospiraceae bacterium]|nr:rod shape-determining protein MreD [Lachnospiraceae bacterium]
MRRIIVTGLLIIINIVIQSTLLQHIAIRGVIPNTAVIMIVSFALLRGSVSGAATGFFAGLLCDILFGNTFGFYALLGTVTGWICGSFNTNFYRENYFLPAVLSCASVFLYDCAIYLFGIVQGISFSYISLLFNIILPEAVYTAVFVIPVYRIVFAANEQLESRERRNRRLF